MLPTTFVSSEFSLFERHSGAPAQIWSAALFATIALLMATDVGIEVRRGVPMGLESFECVIFAVALAGIAMHWRRVALVSRRSTALADQLTQAQRDARRWSDALHDGISAAIDEHFERWGLTGAEREIALLQLKGLKHREIAGLRGTSERTVRQQALAVYRKAGLKGRTELAAFFLEDFLGPQPITRP